MIHETQDSYYTSFFPSSSASKRPESNHFFDDEPPQKPDWLLIFTGILFLTSILIAWLVDFPSLLK